MTVLLERLKAQKEPHLSEEQASKIQERQKHHPPNLDPQTAGLKGKMKEPAYISLIY